MAKAECYDCDAEIEVEDSTYVHPLCAECQNEADDWLQTQMLLMN
jgi:Zn finger protein HypA/HybF involved in hydrogenase expression